MEQTLPNPNPNPAAGESEAPRARLPLRDAVRLSGMSEKTLRRKLEAGLLSGHRETLDYGGFMWMIDARSLADLYPDSVAIRDYVQHLESCPPDSHYDSTLEAAEQRYTSPVLSSLQGETGSDEDEDEPEQRPGGPGKDFVLFLLEENRELKEDLRDRERQLRGLQDRAMQLERECGEQRGTAATQARVLEWFQRQPQPALPSGEPVAAPVEPVAAAPAPLQAQAKLWMAVSAVSLLSLLIVAVRAF